MDIDAHTEKCLTERELNNPVGGWWPMMMKEQTRLSAWEIENSTEIQVLNFLPLPPSDVDRELTTMMIGLDWIVVNERRWRRHKGMEIDR